MLRSPVAFTLKGSFSAHTDTHAPAPASANVSVFVCVCGGLQPQTTGPTVRGPAALLLFQ